MPKRYAYNTSATQVKKRYAMIGSTATQVKKRYAMIGSTATLVYSAEEVLADLVTGGYDTHYSITGIPNEKTATSTGHWDLSDYNYIKGNFANTIEQRSWGSGGGEYHNYAKYTYLKFNDGSTKLLFTGDSKTFTESDPIDLTGYTSSQKSKVYLYATRNIDIPNATNTYTAGEGIATSCIAFS